MSDERALLAAICAHPEEDTPRLAYADWLDEHAGAVPKAKRESVRMRAELIRVQCELARLPEEEEDADTATRRADLESRQDVLLHNSARRRAWAKPLQSLTEDGLELPAPDFFVRGFPRFACGRTDTFLRTGESLFEISPLHQLDCPQFSAFRDKAAQLLAQPWLARIRRLRIGNILQRQEVALIEKLLTAPVLTNLEDLELGEWEFGRPGAPITGRTLAHLRRLRLLGGFARGPAAFARLGELLPSETRIRDFALVGVDYYGSEELTTLAALPQFGGLERLTLGTIVSGGDTVSLRADGVRALATAPFWNGLRNFCGTGGAFGPLEVTALPTAPANLRTLSLHCGDAREVIEALSANPLLGTITALNLNSSFLGNSGAESLAASPHLGRLLSLNLARCGVNERGIRVLAESAFGPHLVRLNLDGCTIGPGGIDVLVAPGNFPRLRRLEVRRVPAANAQKNRLRSRFGDGARL